MEISKAKIKMYASLARRKQRESQGLFVAEGQKCVLETLPHFELEALVVEQSLRANLQLPATVNPLHIYEATQRQLEQISSLATPPHMIAVYRLPKTEIPKPDVLKDTLTVALDGVQDPGNLGTIMRTADWFGVRHIIASPQTADIFNPKAVQSTMGAIGRVHISYTSLPEFIDEYREQTGLPVYGTMLEGKDIYATQLKSQGLVVMGNEGRGLTAEVRERVSVPLLIPSWPPGETTVESLNVAMATAVTLAEFRRRLI